MGLDTIPYEQLRADSVAVAAANRYELLRAEVSDSDKEVMWLVWSGLASLSASLLVVVIAGILNPWD